MRKVLFVIGVMLALAMPAYATPGPTEAPKLMFCGADKATWAMQTDSGNENPAKSWSCTVNGMTLLVRTRQQNQRTHHCGATAHLYVSAWVDGVKLVNQDDAGEVMACFDNEALTSISLYKDGMAEVCHQKMSMFDPPNGPPRCERTQAKFWKNKAADPNYVLRDAHTPLELIATVDKADFCAGLSIQMKPDDQDEAIRTFTLSASAWRDVSVPLGKFWENWSQTVSLAQFDIDNDGKIDEVFRGNTMKVHGSMCCELAWPPVGAREWPFVAQIGEPSDWIVFMPMPLRISGRTYVYLRQVPAFDWDDFSEVDAGRSPQSDQRLTRGIVELHPDGRSTLLCGWAPRPRPEEFL